MEAGIPIWLSSCGISYIPMLSSSIKVMIVCFAFERKITFAFLNFPIKMYIIVRVSPCNETFNYRLVPAIKVSATADTLNTDVALITVL